MKRLSKKIFSICLALCVGFSTMCCGSVVNAATSTSTDTSTSYTTDSGIQDSVQDGVILHAFDWSYSTIEDNLSAIANAGYTTIQTSPIQQCKDYNASWTDQEGQWWKLYQPISYELGGNSWLGTKAELTSLCTEAHKYGIKIICDIVFNHFGNDDTGNSGTLASAVKTYMPTIYQDWSDNYNSSNHSSLKYFHYCNSSASDSSVQLTVQGNVSNMISVNTGNSYIQEQATSLLEQSIDCGVDGFRFDAAKHIETPDDGSYASDFWPNVLNAASTYASENQDGKEMFYYGEILNTVGSGRSVSSYTKYMSVTDNVESDKLAYGMYSGSASTVLSALNNNSNGSYINAGSSNTVLWAESHDTYMGSSGSGGMSCTSSYSTTQIDKAWALSGTRKGATALYYARPSETMGEVGSTEYCSDTVTNINKFHNSMVGLKEKFGSSGNVVYNQRGTKGIVLVNCSGTTASVSISGTSLPDGSYTDSMSGNTFKVSSGVLTGSIGSTGIATVYNDNYDESEETTTSTYCLRGSFNSWSDTATPLTASGDTVTATVSLSAGS